MKKNLSEYVYALTIGSLYLAGLSTGIALVCQGFVILAHSTPNSQIKNINWVSYREMAIGSIWIGGGGFISTAFIGTAIALGGDDEA